MANIHGFGGNNKDKKPDHEEFSVGGASSQSAVMRRQQQGGGGDADLNQRLLDMARQNQQQGGEAVKDSSIGNIVLYKVSWLLWHVDFSLQFQKRAAPVL